MQTCFRPAPHIYVKHLLILIDKYPVGVYYS